MIATRCLEPELAGSVALRLTDWVRDGDTIVWGQADAQPRLLTRLLVGQRHDWRSLKIFLGIGCSNILHPNHTDVFELVSYCGTGSNRRLSVAGALDILPCHYSDLPAMIRSGRLQVDVVMLRVSAPDAHGRYSLGLSNDYLCAAVESARVVIAEVDEHVPWTHGERSLVRSDFDLLVHAHTDDAGHGAKAGGAAGPIERAIGRHVASLVEDGSTLQVGIGKVPDAVLAALSDHRDLGFHSGNAGDGWAALAQKGVLTNARKSRDTGVSVAGMVMGSESLYRFVHQNPALQLRGADYTHNLNVLSTLDRFVAINSGLEVDLSGQVNAEVAAGNYVGALGGGADFLRGAHASRGGLPIIALASTGGNQSRIVSTLSGPATLSAGDAGIVVTEFGIADLRGKTLTDRRRLLLDIAHPDYRDVLERS